MSDALLIAAKFFAVMGILSATYAVVWERRMQRHRQPGVSYWQATIRKDGGWRREDLFTPDGLRIQRQASKYGVTAALVWVVALACWAAAIALR